MRARASARPLQELGVLERGGDGRDVLGQHAVGAAEHGVLLVQGRRDAAQAGRNQRRKSRIAAEADHRTGLHLAQQLEGGGDAARQQPSRHGPRPPASADGQGGGGNAIDGARRKVRAIAVAAHVRHQIDGYGSRRPSSCARAKAGNRWPPVPPAASMTDFVLTTAAIASPSHVAGLDTNPGFLTCAGSGRRRVTANSMPIVKPTASMDEPPLEMNGSVMPLAGRSPTLTAMLMIACSANNRTKPAAPAVQRHRPGRHGARTP